MIRTDVLIVGGGPAGAACAWALRRQGYEVLILDRATFPRPKLCAGWITPNVLTDLAFNAEDYPYPLTTVKRLYVSIRGLKLRLPARLYAIRRIEFDDWLVQRSGAPVITHQARQIVQQEDGYTVDGAYFGRYLVGAGGTQCPVARAYFANVNRRDPKALIVTREEEFSHPYPRDGRRDACHLWFFEHKLPGYAWYVPKAEGIVNVGVGGNARTLKARGATIHRHWEILTNTLAELNLVRDYTFAPRSHAYYLREGARRLQVGNVFVAGDAAGMATADMGEGIAAAIQSGLHVAAAITTGSPIDVNTIRRWSQPWPIARLFARFY
jgi:menaquinone-9 beta-reductase